MPLYIPWLTETIKKRGVRYLLHHYLGQFFEEKLTLEQLSIDIYEGKGSIRNLALDVDGLNDELDFIPFKFLDGCLIGQISVEVPWSSLATDACKVELDGAKFVCRLKTSADGSKAHCTESTLLSKSLMTTSMQMAEEIVTTEDDDNSDNNFLPTNNTKNHHHHQQTSDAASSRERDSTGRRKDANQMFEGLEMFAQLIDSVLRRTKLTARDTLFQIQPYSNDDGDADNDMTEKSSESSSDNKATLKRRGNGASSRSSDADEFCEPLARSYGNGDDIEGDDDNIKNNRGQQQANDTPDPSRDTVEFFIKFFRCEEIIDQTRVESDGIGSSSSSRGAQDDEQFKKSLNVMPETITKLLTLEDVEMRIGGVPVSNLTGKHTITIKFNGQKSEISIFTGAPLLAVISHVQLETFFKVFDSAKGSDNESRTATDTEQKLMSPEDYTKIENQLLESASLRAAVQLNELGGGGGHVGHYISSQGVVGAGSGVGVGTGARRWVDDGLGGDNYSCVSGSGQQRSMRESCPDYDYHSANSSTIGSATIKSSNVNNKISEPASLYNIEAFSCELKLPGIWLCILQDGEKFPPLIRPYADSINSFQAINKYIDNHIKVPHIRCLALKVALNLTAKGINVFLGDLDISEYLVDGDNSILSPKLRLLHNDLTNVLMDTSRYKALINNGEVTIDMLADTRIIFDPTIIDRIVYDYKLVKLNNHETQSASLTTTSSAANYIGGGRQQRLASKQRSLAATNASGSQGRGGSIDLNLVIRGERFMIELLCPIPDLTPQAQLKRTQLRPQSFLFDFKDMIITWQSDKLNISTNELMAYVKTQPKQSDREAVKFIEATESKSDKIVLILEPSPSNLDNAFPNDVEQALNESSLYDSIYVGQATESRIPTEAFQTKQKVVRASLKNTKQHKSTPGKPSPDSSNARLSECDRERILTPGDRQHLLDYLDQTLMATKLNLSLHLPICEVEFEDKEQLDLIYNRFGNDFVFWQPKAIKRNAIQRSRSSRLSDRVKAKRKSSAATAQHPTYRRRNRSSRVGARFRPFKTTTEQNYSDTSSVNDEDDDLIVHDDEGEMDDDDDDDFADDNDDDDASEASYHSGNYAAASGAVGSGNLNGYLYDNQVTCKIRVDELIVRFNHQSCAAAMKQEISVDNLLLGVIIDVNKKPNTILSLVADNLELSTDSVRVLEGNHFGVKNSTISLTAEIKRPTKSLKDIKLAIQLRNGLLNEFKTDTYTRFWQSINVTDEPILGYIAPKIVTELHIDILNTAISIVKENARPALLSIDELYITSMVMEQTSQVMIRLIADEVSLYLKRSRKSFELMKNYICLVDSGLIDLDVKYSQDGRLEFGVINNVITMRVCQDSLSALCKLFNVLIRDSTTDLATATVTTTTDKQATTTTTDHSSNISDTNERENFVAQVGQDDKDTTTTINRGSSSSQLIKGKREKSGASGGVGSSRDKSGSSKSPVSLAGFGDINKKKNIGGDVKREMNLLADAMNDDFSLTAHGNSSNEQPNASRDESASTTDRYITAYESDDSRRRHIDQEEEDEESDDNNDYDDDVDDDDDNNNDYSDSDGSSDPNPPILEYQASTPIRNDQTSKRQRDPSACLLDESNPLIGDFFSQPLLPLQDNDEEDDDDNDANNTDENNYDDDDEKKKEEDEKYATSSSLLLDGSSCSGSRQAALGESGFFIIGDDDVGAGIINNKQSEPAVRKLIEGPINIVENHFKLTKPRTIPEMLANSLERYVLEEMTLVVNLFGGRDFDDLDPSESDIAPAAGTNPTTATTTTTTTTTTTNDTTTTLDKNNTASNGGGELLADSSGAGSHLEFPATVANIRGRAGSMASTSIAGHSLHNKGGQQQQAVASNNSNSNSLKRKLGSRRKHLSEGSGGGASELAPSGSNGAGRHQHQQAPAAEQRVRFGEGTVNLWESLDLMSSPDLLGGTRPRPSQPALNSDSKQAGGAWRQTDVCIQLTLSKVKLLYELTDASASASSTGGAGAGAASSMPPACVVGAAGGGAASGGQQNLRGGAICTPVPATGRHYQESAAKNRQVHRPATAAALSSTAKRPTGDKTNRQPSAAPVSSAAPTTTTTTTSVAAAAGPISWRFMLFIDDIEVKDRIAASDINKMLYEYCTEAMPRRSTQFLTIKNTANINPSDGCEECDLRVSLKPLRLNIDQTMLLFLIEFFTNLQKSLSKQQSIYSTGAGSSSGPPPNPAKCCERGPPASSAAGGLAKTITTPAAASVRQGTSKGRGGGGKSKGLAQLGSSGVGATADANAAGALETSSDSGGSACSSSTSMSSNGSLGGDGGANGELGAASDNALPTHCHSDLRAGCAANQQPIYIKSFTFSPEVPIRLDYHAKHLDFEQGALAGILLGLAHLDHSELVLRRVQAKHGMRGLDRVLLFAINSWLTDIKRKQLPSILSGVGPMHNVIQLFQGVRDLIWMPIDHYRKDKRLVRGLQRGASSFSSSTAMAAINLVNRFISIVQCTAQIAHDIVTPPASMPAHHHHHHHHHHTRLQHRSLKSLGGGSSAASGGSAQLSLGGGGTNLRHHSRLAGACHHASQSASGGAGGHSGGSLSSCGGGGAGSLLVGAGAHANQGLNQPRNFCEGVAVGFTIIKEGFNDTARNVTVGLQAEDMRSAVGELVRQIPSTLLNPIISATEGAQSVLVGIRNQIAPEARREDQEKWKRKARGK